MSKLVLICVLVLVVFAVPSFGQVFINEVYSGGTDFYELINVGAAPVDISGWRVDTYEAASAINPAFDTSFTFPAGTIIGPDSFVVGQDSTTGTGPSIFYVGTNIFFISGYAMEVILYDAGGGGVDYWYADSYGYGPTTNQPAGVIWNGTFASVSGNDGHYRTNKVDTDNASDWTNGTSETKGSNNPGQGPMPPVAGLIINEFYTGLVPAIELYNTTSSAIDVSDYIVMTAFANSASATSLTPEIAFTIPTGTSIGPKGFLVLEAFGTPGAPGTYPASIQTGIAYAWSGTTTVEIALLDNQGVFTQGVDYVFYDHFGTFPGMAPSLPAPTLWTGNFAMGTGDTHERIQVSDTDSAADWAKTTTAHSLGTFNPPQASGTFGIVINEFSTGVPDWCELLNTTANPVDVSGYEIQVHDRSGSGSASTDPLHILPAGSVIPAGGVMCFVEGGTAGAPYTTAPFVNAVHTGFNWTSVSSWNMEIILSGPLGIVPLDYVEASIDENLEAFPSGFKPGSLNWTGTCCSVGSVSADIIERLTIVDRDNAGDWVRNGLYTSAGTPGVLNPTQAAGCTGYFSHYGTGCMSLLYEPVLFGTGCPTAGGTITTELAFAPAGAPALIVIGLGNLSLPMTACCDLQVNPIINPQVAIVMPSGTLSIPATLPATLPGPVDVYVQVLFGDVSNPCGISSTNPLQFHVE